MAVSLGAFDPKVSDAEAYKMLCLAFPDLPARMKKAEAEFMERSVFAHYIASEYVAPDRDCG